MGVIKIDKVLKKINWHMVFIVPSLIGSIIKLALGRRFKGMIVYIALIFIIIGAILPTLMVEGGLHFLRQFNGLISFYFLAGMVYVFIAEWNDKDIDSKGELGKAKFSTEQDLHNAGLVGNGIVFGKMQGKIIEKPSSKDGHVLIIGGSGSGKSSANAIPTLLRWNGTGLIIDIKGELSQKTSHLHDNSIVFSTEERLARYNPLDFVNEIEDVQEMGRLMFPKPEKGDAFWTQAAQSIFASACWEYRFTKTFSEVAQWLCSEPDREIVDTLLSSDELETKMLANTVNNLKPETLGSIFAELRGKLMTIAIDKNIQYATSASDFSPESIENNMIYLQVSEKRLKQYGELFGIMVGQYLRYLMGRAEGQSPPVLIMLDEFPRLGEMSGIVEGLATLRSRNVHLTIMIQSLAQLDDVYSKEKRKVIVDNCAYRLVLGANDSDTQKYFSDIAGSKTVKIKSYSQKEGYRNEQTFTTQEQTVPLIRPEEFGVLEKPILFGPKMRPAEVEQAFWFKDSNMTKLVENNAEVS